MAFDVFCQLHRCRVASPCVVTTRFLFGLLTTASPECFSWLQTCAPPPPPRPDNQIISNAQSKMGRHSAVVEGRSIISVSFTSVRRKSHTWLLVSSRSEREMESLCLGDTPEQTLVRRSGGLSQLFCQSLLLLALTLFHSVVSVHIIHVILTKHDSKGS